MRVPLSIAAAAVLMTGPVALHASDPEPSDLDQLVSAERSFSAYSVEHGMRDAFLAYLCDNGIVFRPGPVNGKRAWKTLPESQGTLRLAPRFAEVAGNGDLGYTTGPWEFTPAGDRKLQPTHGEYVSVWKRGRDGNWCAAVSLRTSDEHAPAELADVKLERGPAHPKPPRKSRSGLGIGVSVFNRGSGLGVGLGSGTNAYEEEQRVVAHAINTLMSAEREYGFNLRKLGAGRAYPRVAAEDVRFLRDDSPPEVGMTPAIAELEKRGGEVEWRSFGSGASTSADLGYSYGLIHRRVSATSKPDTSAYLHVWRKGPDGKWKMALDVESAFQKP